MAAGWLRGPAAPFRKMENRAASSFCKIETQGSKLQCFPLIGKKFGVLELAIVHASANFDDALGRIFEGFSGSMLEAVQ
jgi:hypothetical protein